MPREILMHLNVGVPADDTRTVEQVEAAVKGALEVGSDDDAVRDLDIVFALTEEI